MEVKAAINKGYYQEIGFFRQYERSYSDFYQLIDRCIQIKSYEEYSYVYREGQQANEGNFSMCLTPFSIFYDLRYS